MSGITRYEHLRHRSLPTRKQEKLYKTWRAYLKDSRLTEAEQHSRASSFADQNREVPNDG
jgi:phage regulator Rha-like protein